MTYLPYFVEVRLMGGLKNYLYDLLQDRLLSRDDALSSGSWDRTTSLLAERRSPTDHEACRPLSTLERLRHDLEVKLFG